MKILITLNTFLLLGILAFVTACNGQRAPQNLSKSRLEIADSILVVFHDSHDNYWFGSNGRGVYKYDGKTMQQFTTKEGISNNHIWEIKEDRTGNIFISTANGINKYDGKTITVLKAINTNAEWKSEPGDLWFKNGMEDGCPYRYDGKNLYQLQFPKNNKEDVFRSMFPGRIYNPYAIYQIYNDSKGRVWFGTAVLGVGCYDGKNFTWINEDDLTEIHNGPSNGVRSIVEDKDGVFWFGNTFYKYTIAATDKGISYKRDKGIKLPKQHGMDGFEYMSATTDNDGNLWIVTFNNGVWKYDGKEINQYTVKNGSNVVTLFSIYKDKQGALWLGTHTDGVYEWNGSSFEKFKF